MGVVDVKRAPSLDSSHSGPDTIRRSLGWTVLVDTHGELPEVVEFATGIPRRGDPYPGSFGHFLFCTDVRVSPKAPLLFNVVADWESPTIPGGGGGGRDENPLSLPADIRWYGQTELVPIDRDRDGKPILNTALQGPNPPVQKLVVDQVVQIGQNVASVNQRHMKDYGGSINALSVGIWPPETGLMLPWEVDLIRLSRKFSYYRRVITIVFRSRVVKGREYGWNERYLNQGTHEYFGVDALKKNIIQPIKNADNTNTTTQHLLGLNGRRLAATDQAVYLTAKVQDKKSWAPLNLPI